VNWLNNCVFESLLSEWQSGRFSVRIPVPVNLLFLTAHGSSIRAQGGCW